MTRAIQHDDWPVELTDDQITSRVSHRAFRRGPGYACKGWMRDISVVGDGNVISAQPKDSGAHAYQTIAFHKQGTHSVPVF